MPEPIEGPQNKKSTRIFGTVDQSSFYGALEADKDVVIEVKFKQSGFDGFLPLSDPGVCNFMSDDFAKAVTEGRYETWKSKISERNAEFIEYFRVGQHEAGTREYGPQTNHDLTSNKNSYTHETRKSFESDRSALGEKISDQMKSTESSCMEAPCVKLVVKLRRMGIARQEFQHAMMFTMATKKNGELDKEHLLFMDPNAGIFKIKNNKESIDRFLQNIDRNLFSQMQVVSMETHLVTNKSLPKKGTEAWNERDKAIKDGKTPDHEANYSLSKLCLLETYLNKQIDRLENAGWLKQKFLSDNKDKLAHLQGVQDELCKKIGELKEKKLPPKEYLEEADKIAHEVFASIDSKILSARRGLGLMESKSLANLNDLKKTMGEFKGELHHLHEEAHKAEQQVTASAESDSSKADKPEDDWVDDIISHPHLG